jgi:hypothetical protein
MALDDGYGARSLLCAFSEFIGNRDRKQHFDVRYPSHAIIRAILTPAGSGGEGKPPHPDVFLMDKRNFITTADARFARSVRCDSGTISHR